MIGSHLPTHFTPSSAKLLAMIVLANQKFEADRQSMLSQLTTTQP